MTAPNLVEPGELVARGAVVCGRAICVDVYKLSLIYVYMLTGIKIELKYKIFYKNRAVF